MADSYAQHIAAVSTVLNNVPQQMQSVLSGAVQYDSNYGSPGTSFFLDDRGTTDPQEAQGKGGRIEPRELQGFRVGGNFVGDEDWFYVYEEDKVRELLDPTNTDIQSLMGGMERKKDRDIINNGLLGITMSASGGAPGALDTQNSFPSGQILADNDRSNLHDTEAKVVAASGPLGPTIGKLITVDAMLKRSLVQGKKYIACDEYFKANLLASTPITSSFYNNVQALVEGKVTQFMGFEFLEFSSTNNFLPTYTATGSLPATGYVAWIDKAVYYRQRMITNVNVAKDITVKGHPVQVYYKRERAWARRYAAGVVRFNCTQQRQLA